MYRLKKMKFMAVFITMCMIVGLIPVNTYAYIGTDPAELIYVGGDNAKADNTGSSTEPFLTLKEAADKINTDTEGGSYEIIMQGNTAEAIPVVFGTGSAEYDITICTSVTGSAIQVNKASSSTTFTISTGTSMTLEGASSETGLIFDGGGNLYSGDKPLFNISAGATLNLNNYATIQNNFVMKTNENGSGIYNDGTLTLNGGNVSGNHSILSGAGIYNNRIMVMNGGNVSNNSCQNYGAGIYNNGTFTFINGTVSNNSSSVGSGIFNNNMLFMNGGMVSFNDNVCLFNTNTGNVMMSGGAIEYNSGLQAVCNQGNFTMLGGSISNNTYLSNQTTIAIANGTFTMVGGYIQNNTGNFVLSTNEDATFNMQGGTISNNTVTNAVIGTWGNFAISNGVISDNVGDAIFTAAPITIADNASILGESGGIANIRIENLDLSNCVTISGTLNNISSVKLILSQLRDGIQVLTANNLPQDIISKFQLADPNYIIDDSGKASYSGEKMVFYVNAGGSNTNSGSSLEPLQTMAEAITRIGIYPGTIIVQSDLEITNTLMIGSDITIKSDGQTRILHQKVETNPFDSLFLVSYGKLTLGDNNQVAGSLVIENDTNNISRLIGAFYSTVNMESNATIQNSNFINGVICNSDSSFTLNGGSIINCKGVAVYNFTNSTINILGGTIRSAVVENDNSTAIINEAGNTINMSGGNIEGFNGAQSAGIINKGALKLSGGALVDNTNSIYNGGDFTLYGEVTIPAGEGNLNSVYLPNGKFITVDDKLQISANNYITIFLENIGHNLVVLTGSGEALHNNYDNFKLTDNQFNLSEEGKSVFVGERPVYYVDVNYSGSDSDGSFEKPYNNLNDPVNKINTTTGLGEIQLCSDIELSSNLLIHSSISLQNYGEIAHTITYANGFCRIYIYEDGALSLGKEGAGNDDNPSLIFTGNSSYDGFFSNEGSLKMYPGVKLADMNIQYGGSAIENYGTFSMYGGLIIGISSYYSSGGVKNEGTFLMEGGKIANCKGASGGAVFNSGSFIMTGGTIENNSLYPDSVGAAIFNAGDFHISGNASVPAGEIGNNDIYLFLDCVIDIDTNLTGSDQFLLTMMAHSSGRVVLKGDAGILNNNYQKFILGVDNYTILSDGTLGYTSEVLDYYVDQVNGADSNSGTQEEPFATLGQAVSAIDNKVGTIHICSDLTITEPVIIDGTITIVNEGNPHSIRRSENFDTSSYSGNINDLGMVLVFGKLELGAAEAGGDNSVNLTFDGNRDTIQSEGALISNYGYLILNKGVVMQNNDSWGYVGGIYNEGSFTMAGGTIQNNNADSDAGGLYNIGKAVIIDGSIISNTGYAGGGIYSNGWYFKANLTILGGNISNNSAQNYGGIYICNSDVIMSGGVISGNDATNSKEGDIGNGAYLELNSSLTLSKDAYIASDNDIFLINDETSDIQPVILIAEALADNVPTMMIQRGMYSSYTGQIEPYYHVGDQILVPSGNYTLTKQDISKFILADSNYGINDSGVISTRLQESWVAIDNTTSYSYAGSVIEPTIMVKNGATILTKDKDYQVIYSNNMNAGTATVNVYGIGNYGGNVTKTFTINKAVLQRIITANPANQTFLASQGKTEEELRSSISLTSVRVSLNSGTVILPITWALSEGSYNPKGGTYTYIGTLTANDNIEVGSNKLTTVITVTEETLNKPTFHDINVTSGGNRQATPQDLGASVLPTQGSIQAGNTTVNYTIGWNDGTLDTTKVGGSTTFTGIITYQNAPDWASLPDDTEVMRKVIVVSSPSSGFPGTPTTGTGTDTDNENNTSSIVYNEETQELVASYHLSNSYIQDLIREGETSGQDEITIPLGSDEINELLQEGSVERVMMDVVLPDSVTHNNDITCHIQLDSEILKTAREHETDVQVSVKDENGKERYSWTFPGSDLAARNNDIVDLDLSLKIEKAENNQEISRLLSQGTQDGNEESNNLIINFGYHGELPAQASVKLFVGDMGYKEGDKLYLYYYNEETGKLDALPYSSDYQVDSDGYVTINIVHCSNYVLLPQEGDSDMITSLLDQISLLKNKATLYYASKGYNTATIQVNLPNTLERVSDFDEDTSSNAIGGVVVTYRSSNTKIATVSSKGKITAKATGKAVITVTAKLYNGTSKIYKFNVTVKKPYIKLINATEMMKVGDSFTFTAKAYGLNLKDIIWKTTKKSIVVINKKTGKASAVMKGTDYVTATINNVTIKIKVVVK